MLRNLIIIICSFYVSMVHGYNILYVRRDPMNFVDEQIANILTATPDSSWFDKTISSSISIIDPSKLCLLPDWEICLPSSDLGLCDTMYNNNNNNSNVGYKDGRGTTKNDNPNATTTTTQQVSVSVLVHLASYCELHIFNNTTDATTSIDHILPNDIRALLTPILSPSSAEDRVYYDAHVIIASQFVLQMLETELCLLLSKHSPGRAPLLKDMVEAMGNLEFQETTSTSAYLDGPHYCSMIAKVLRALLLPKGLNLRNLLWHGFLSNLHRRWLALSVVLLMSVKGLAREKRKQMQTTNISEEKEQQPTCYSAFEPLSRYGASLLQAPSNRNYIHNLSQYITASSFLPASYLNLIQTAMLEYNPLYYPACFCAIISPLVEHGLRLLWCKCNDKNHMAFAQMNTYYVTLDGIGQRDRHNLLLLPILDLEENDSSATTAITNKLVFTLGAPIMSLLADLFLSPCGGPNVRSALAHGNSMWDEALFSELNEKAKKKIISFKSSTSPDHDGDTGIANNKSAKYSASLNIATNIAFTLITILRLLADKATAMNGENMYTTSLQKNLLPAVNFNINSYRPVFSYASSLVANVDKTIVNLHYLRTIMKNDENGNKFVQAAIKNMNIVKG